MEEDGGIEKHLHRPKRSEQDCRFWGVAAARCINRWNRPSPLFSKRLGGKKYYTKNVYNRRNIRKKEEEAARTAAGAARRDVTGEELGKKNLGVAYKWRNEEEEIHRQKTLARVIVVVYSSSTCICNPWEDNSSEEEAEEERSRALKARKIRQSCFLADFRLAGYDANLDRRRCRRWRLVSVCLLPYSRGRGTTLKAMCTRIISRKKKPTVQCLD